MYSVYPSTIAEALNLPRCLLLYLTPEDIFKIRETAAKKIACTTY